MKKPLSAIRYQLSAKNRLRMLGLLCFFLFTIYFLPSTALAANTFRIGPPAGSNVGIQVKGTADDALQTVINNALTIVYSFGAILVFMYFVWGTVDWILAGGDKDKIGNARKKMVHSLYGLALLALSAIIITVVGEILNLNPLKVLNIPGLGDAPAATAPVKKP